MIWGIRIDGSKTLRQLRQVKQMQTNIIHILNSKSWKIFTIPGTPVSTGYLIGLLNHQLAISG